MWRIGRDPECLVFLLKYRRECNADKSKLMMVEGEEGSMFRLEAIRLRKLRLRLDRLNAWSLCFLMCNGAT